MATNLPGIVDGEDTGEDMDLGYNDANPPTDQGGDRITDGDDTIYGNGGDDTIDGAGGDDVIRGDGPDGGVSAREVFQWSEAPNFGNLNNAGGFTQDTGEASITFSIESEDPGTQSQYETSDQFTDGLDPAVDENASFESVTNGRDNSVTYRWAVEGGETVENVEFRVNDIDGDGTIIVRAYDENGNEIPVTITDAGSGIDTSSNNGLPGDNVADSSDGNYTDDDSPEHSVIVSIDGPVAYWEVEHVQDGSGNSGINITDIAFDASGAGTPGNDVIDGSEGNDDIDGGDGQDTVTGGDGDDTLSGGADDDTIIGNDGNDVVNDTEGNNTVDTSSDAGQSALPDLGYPGLFPADGDPDDDRDSVTTGDGDDNIRTGDDGDTIVSGGGDDTINAGIDADTIDAGDGNDEITSGEGSDFVDAGAGDDTVFGGLGPSFPDELNITDDDTGFPSPDLVTNNGMDTIFAGDGNDVVFGEDDDDEIYGEGGDDTLDGGIDDDTIDGGAGNDEMTGGQGNDVFVETAGEGADTITDFGEQDTGPITDGDQSNNDFVDLGGFYNDTTLADVNAAGGSFANPLDMLREDASDGTIDGEIGGVDYSAEIGDVNLTLQDGSGGTVTGTGLTFDNPNVACFVRGTLIATRRGSVPIEELAIGDELITMDHGFQKIRWIGSTTVPADGRLAPVVFRRGAMGNERDLRVSPQHRMLVRGWHVELMFGKPEALVPAKALINDETVFQLEGGEVEYFHIMFDRHELVYAEGIPSESFHPGHVGLGSFAEDTREEILHIFPELREDAAAYSEPVRPTLKVREARVLAENPELIKE